MKNATGLMALAAALVLVSCAPDPQVLLVRAGQAFARHDYKAAQLDLATVMKSRGDDPAALELHARTALALGDGVGSKASLDKLPMGRRPRDYALLQGEAALLRHAADQAETAVASDRSAEAWRVRAMAALLRGDDAAALARFTSGAAALGPRGRLLADFARFRLHHGDLVGARDLADSAVRAAPDTLDPLLVSAQLAAASGDLRRALTLYDRIGRGWPGNMAALTGKAATLGDLGRTRELDELLASASQAGASGPDLAWLQARAAAAKRDWPRARDILQANEADLAGRTDATLLYADILTHLGQPEQARARLQPLLTQEPGNVAVRRALARAALAAGDARGAVEALRPLTGRPETSSADLRLLAEAARQAGDSDAASLAQRARYPSPQELARTLADADVAMKAGNWANAASAYEKILGVTDGRNPLVLNNLAIAHQQLGNTNSALQYAERALRAAPTSPSVLDTAGWLLFQTGGNRGRALALLQDAASRAPANETIRKHLAAAQNR